LRDEALSCCLTIVRSMTAAEIIHLILKTDEDMRNVLNWVELEVLIGEYERFMEMRMPSN